jgi:hypothetical protein
MAPTFSVSSLLEELGKDDVYQMLMITLVQDLQVALSTLALFFT